MVVGVEPEGTVVAGEDDVGVWADDAGTTVGRDAAAVVVVDVGEAGGDVVTGTVVEDAAADPPAVPGDAPEPDEPDASAAGASSVRTTSVCWASFPDAADGSSWAVPPVGSRRGVVVVVVEAAEREPSSPSDEQPAATRTTQASPTANRPERRRSSPRRSPIARPVALPTDAGYGSLPAHGDADFALLEGTRPQG